MERPTDYSSQQRRGRKVPQVHRLCPFVMLTPYPKSAARSVARHKHFPENFQGVVIPFQLEPHHHHHHRRCCPQHTYTDPAAKSQAHFNIFLIKIKFNIFFYVYYFSYCSKASKEQKFNVHSFYLLSPTMKCVTSQVSNK